MKVESQCAILHLLMGINMSDYADRIKPESSAIRTYLENLKDGLYQIPTFQRDIVWEEYNVKKLWDSIYKFYPLGSILVWDTKIKLQKHREIGGHLLENTDSDIFKYLLDGQQRTTSLLTSIYGGKIKHKPDFNPQLYIDLTIELEDETDDKSFRELFLFWHEIDDRNGENKRNIQRQSRYNEGLIVTLEQIQHSYGAIEEKLYEAGYTYKDPVLANLRRMRDVFDNYRISFITLKGIQVAEVCQIFERINQAGKPLDIFDIVVAKTFQVASAENEKKGFYLRELFDEFRGNIEGHYNKVDNLTLLQMLAIIIRLDIENSGVFNITERYLNEIKTEHIQQIWEKASKSILKVFSFFDKNLYLKGPNLVPYRYFYLTLVAYFYYNDNPDYEFLESYFWYYSFHNSDLLSNTTNLWEQVNMLKEAAEGQEVNFETFTIDRNSLRLAKYSTRGRYSRAILAFFSNHLPKDWGSNKLIISETYYGITDRPNLHHIFPMEFINQHHGNCKVDSNTLMNIAYLSALTNIQIGAKNPLEYIKEFDTNQDFRKILVDHFIPLTILEWSYADEMPSNALDIFVEKRIDLVIKTLEEKLTKGIAVQIQEIDTAEEDVKDAVNAIARPTVSQLISEGEGTRIELKETLRINTHTNQPDNAMEFACLKTLAAFLNSKGGHLIIGVHDSGEVKGIERDNFPNEDKFYLHFSNLVTRSLGAEQMFFMEPKFEELHEQKVFTVECQPSSAPVFLTFNKKEHFFIRAGAGTRELAMSEVQSFIKNRFIS